MLQKKKKCAEDLAKVIAQKHANQTGIVYCCSRRDCEEVAAARRGGSATAEAREAQEANIRRETERERVSLEYDGGAEGLPEVRARASRDGERASFATTDAPPRGPPRAPPTVTLTEDA